MSQLQEATGDVTN